MLGFHKSGHILRYIQIILTSTLWDSKSDKLGHYFIYSFQYFTTYGIEKLQYEETIPTQGMALAE